MKVKVSQLKNNPNNPRVIKDHQFHKLVKSIKDFPDMLKVRKLICTPDYVVLGGNMRLKALQEAGIKEVDVEIVDWDEEKQRQFIIKDNLSYGEWDWDILINEWDEIELSEWGMNTTFFTDADRINELHKELDNVGLPDFDIKDPKCVLTISFENEQDRDTFVNEKQVSIAKKGTNVWSTWWPERERDDLKGLKYD